MDAIHASARAQSDGEPCVWRWPRARTKGSKLSSEICFCFFFCSLFIYFFKGPVCKVSYHWMLRKHIANCSLHLVPRARSDRAPQPSQTGPLNLCSLPASGQFTMKTTRPICRARVNSPLEGADGTSGGRFAFDACAPLRAAASATRNVFNVFVSSQLRLCLRHPTRRVCSLCTGDCVTPD